MYRRVEWKRDFVTECIQFVHNNDLYCIPENMRLRDALSFLNDEHDYYVVDSNSNKINPSTLVQNAFQTNNLFYIQEPFNSKESTDNDLEIARLLQMQLETEYAEREKRREQEEADSLALVYQLQLNDNFQEEERKKKRQEEESASLVLAMELNERFRREREAIKRLMLNGQDQCAINQLLQEEKTIYSTLTGPGLCLRNYSQKDY